jgi:DNA helicase HerA-like ATPase
MESAARTSALDKTKSRIIGTVTADEMSPSFDMFRFKALANEYVYPGTVVGTSVSQSKFLLGRISSAVEVNPHESAARISVRHAMDIEPDYPEEGLSTSVYRVYEVEIIEEGFVESTSIKIGEPADMAKAGAEVFVPTETVIAQAMGFQTDPMTALSVGRTRVTSDYDSGGNNVLLNRDIVQRHIFVGGTTGSGKSWGTSILLEEINRLGLPIIILDSQHEYESLASGLGGKVLKPGRDYSVRLSSLSESEALDLVPTLRTSTQGTELLAFTFLRLKREKKVFDLADLLKGMEGDAKTISIKPDSLRIALSRTSGSIERHSFIGGQTEWNKLLLQFPVINVDCGNLDQSQLQLLVGTTLRELTSQRLRQAIPPYVIVLDEAHLLVPEHEDTICKQVIRENVRIGRHYGISVILITQSPVDIDKKTIRQCNTRLIFALEPDQLDSLRGVRADATEEMLRSLSKMPQGTCLLSGTYETIRHAIPIKIRSDRKTPPGGTTPNIFEEMKRVWNQKKNPT